MSTPVDPDHYKSHPSGIECIQVAIHHSFGVGNVLKYLWRSGLKTQPGRDVLDSEIEDLEKAQRYLTFEIENKKKLRDEVRRADDLGRYTTRT